VFYVCSLVNIIVYVMGGWFGTAPFHRRYGAELPKCKNKKYNRVLHRHVTVMTKHKGIMWLIWQSSTASCNWYDRAQERRDWYDRAQQRHVTDMTEHNSVMWLIWQSTTASCDWYDRAQQCHVTDAALPFPPSWSPDLPVYIAKRATWEKHHRGSSELMSLCITPCWTANRLELVTLALELFVAVLYSSPLCDGLLSCFCRVHRTRKIWNMGNLWVSSHHPRTTSSRYAGSWSA